jgi:RHS repeat-associated protein
MTKSVWARLGAALSLRAFASPDARVFAHGAQSLGTAAPLPAAANRTWKWGAALLAVAWSQACVAAGTIYVAGPVAYTPYGTQAPVGSTVLAGLSYTIKASTPGDSAYKVELREVSGGSFISYGTKTYMPKMDSAGDAPINTPVASNSTGSLAIGVHVLYLHTTTFNYEQDDSPQVTVTITSSQASPPVATLTSPASGATYQVAAGGYYVVPVTGAATQDGGGTISSTRIVSDGKVVQTFTGASAASVSASVSLAAGSHSIYLSTTNNAGVVSASAAASVIVNQPPVANLFTPTSRVDAWPGYPVAIGITGSALDPDSGDAITKTEVIVNGVAQAPLSAGNLTAISTSYVVPTPGTYQVQLRTTDSRGAVAYSTTATVVMNALPVVTMNSPANGAIYQTTTGGSYAVPVIGTATDDGAISSTQLLVDGQVVFTAPNGSVSTSYTVAAGTHTFQLIATDNLSQPTAAGVATIIVNQPPTVTMTAPVSGVLMWAGSNLPIAISGTAADPDTGDSIAKTEVLVNGVAQPPLTGASASTVSTTYVATAAGTYQIALRTTDARGATTTTPAVTVNVDAPPTVALQTPVNGSQVLANGSTGTVTVQGTGGDPDAAGSGREFDHLTLTVDGVINSTVTTTTLSKSLSLGIGAHTVLLTSTDKLGRATSVSNSVTVVADRAPTGSLSSPTGSQVFSIYAGNAATVPVVGTMTDPDGALGDSVARTEIWVDGIVSKSVTGGVVNTTVGVSASGAHSVKLHAFDSAGVTGDSAAVNVIINVLGPMTGYVDGVAYDVTGAPMLNGWACDKGVAASVNVVLYAGGPAGTGTQIGTLTANVASEAAVGTACGTAGTTYRWTLPLLSLQSARGGQALYVYGISAQNGGVQTLLPNSGNTSIPAVGTTIPVTIAPPLLGQPDAGTLPGNLSVTGTGAAAYSIPIQVPPGSGGMKPSLGLAYSSDAPSGPLGIGWTLDGLGAIRRCAKTVAQDGTPGRVRFDNGDRLCLEGQRLVRVNGTGQDDSSYWAANGEYRTEAESFTRISALASGFKVERKDGGVEYYGTQSLAIRTVGPATASTLFWPLSRREDHSGNYLTVAYLDEGQGEYVPSQVSYGGNSGNGLAPDLAVRFVYEVRPDPQVRYLGGSRNDQRYRISHVQTFTGISADGSGGSKVRDYAMTYRQSQSSSRSMLDSVQACATNPVSSATECLPKTSFEWGQQAIWSQSSVPFSLGTVSTRPVIPVGRGVRSQRSQANLDGSGMPSYVIAKTVGVCEPCEPIDESTWHDYLTGTLSVTPSGGGAATTYTLSFAAAFPDKIDGFQFGDFNGDGLDDAVLGRGGEIAAICMNNGTTTLSCQNWVAPTGFAPKFAAPVDLYNDRRMHFRQGAADVWLGVDKQWHGQAISVVDVTPPALSTPIKTAPSQSEPISFSAQDISDFYYVFPPSGLTNEFPGMLRSCVESTVATGLQYTCQTLVASPTGDYGSESSGDLNGDGLTDFLFMMSGTNVMVCLSTEVGVKCSDSGLPIPSGKANIGDFVGDGSTGVLFAASSSSTSKYCRLDGDIKLQCKSLIYPDTSGPYASDIQAVDLSRIPAWLFIDKSANVGTGMESVKPYTLKAPASQDRISAAVNGVGLRQEIDYARGDDAVTVRRLAQLNGVDQPFVYPLVAQSVTGAVKELRTSNGHGSWLKTDYHYEGAAWIASGRGSAGFAVVRSTDLPSNITKTQYLRQDFPFTGLPNHTTSVASNGTVLEDTVATLTSKTMTPIAGGGATLFVVASPVVTVRHELANNALLGTETVVDKYEDGWGNRTNSVVTVSDGTKTFTASKSTNYQNIGTTGLWIGGLPLTTCEKRSGPDGVESSPRVVSHAYDSSGRIQSDVLAPAAFNCFGAAGTSAPGATVTAIYDRSGNSFGLTNKITQSWADPNTGSTVARLTRDVDYDARGRFELTGRNALGQAEQQTFYPTTGARKTHTDLNGLVTSMTVDGFGRATKQVDGDKTETRLYIKQCDTTCPQGALSAKIVDTFNGADRVRVPSVSFLDALGHEIQRATWGFEGRAVLQETRYDSAGRVYEIDQPRFASDAAYLSERRLYDDLNRLTSTTTKREDGTESSATTQYLGLTRVLTNNKSQQLTQALDLLGRAVTATNATAQGNVVTQYGYTAFGDLTKTIDPNGNVINVSFDNYGHRTDLRDPDVGWVHYDVDPVGRTWRHINPNQRAAGTSTRDQFDALDRTTDSFEPDLERHFIYDTAAHGLGALAEAFTGPSSAKDYRRQQAYDTLGRPSTTTTTLGGVQYQSTPNYDAWSRVATSVEQRASDTAKVFSRRYNARGDLGAISHGGVDLWAATAEDASLRVLTSTLGNGLVDIKHYDPYTSRLDDSIAQVGAAGAKRIHEHDTFDVLGNVLVRTGEYNYGLPDASAYKDTFGYDDLNRLTSDQEWANAPKNYSFDPAGNLKTKNDPSSSPAVVATYGYPAQGPSSVQPHAVQSITGWPGAFVYDANGNQKASPTGLSTTWNSFDMPIRITRTVNALSSYDEFVYGSEHQRTKMTSGVGSAVSSVTYYAGNLEVQTDVSGNVVQVKTYWPAGLGFEVDKPSQPSAMYWVHRDRLGSAMALTDATGALVEKLNYDAWGKRRFPNGIGTDASIVGQHDDKGFTGHQMLDNVALVHMNGRVYDPFVGRFISADPLIQDPLNGQSYNRYSYVLNNPTNLTDPSGFASTGGKEGEKKPDVKEPDCDAKCVADKVKQAAEAKKTIIVVDENGNIVDIAVYKNGGYTVFSASSRIGASQGDAKVSADPHAGLDWFDRIMVDAPTPSARVSEFIAGFGSSSSYGITDLQNATAQNTVSYYTGAVFGAVPGLFTGSDEVNGIRWLGKLNPCKCFVAGTVVQTKDGPVAIEKLKVGDLVLAKDETTGEIGLKPVLRLVRNGEKQVIRLTFLNASGKEASLGVTAEHPFMVEGQRWVAAGQLKSGDRLMTLGDGLLTVKSSMKYGIRHHTYNFEVADFHTYFVGFDGVWVHNAGLCDLAAKAINLPGWSKLTVDMEHIADRHMVDGALNAGKSVFVGLNEKGVMAAIRQAYGSATTVAVQGERALLSGVTKTGMRVEMWLNKATKMIETAYPVAR